MRSFEFTLAFLVAPADQENVVARVQAEVPSITAVLARRGRMEVTFKRQSDSAYQMLKSAIAEIKAAAPGAGCVLY